MTKNIIVVDENGKKYGTTYRKRAKGLVKQGRARFIKPDMLCLARPPEQNLEDKKNMESENINIEDTTIMNAASENTETSDTAATGTTDCSAAENKYSMEYCLRQIERISSQTEYLNQVIAEMRQLGNDPFSGEKARALSDIVRCRETTNQQMLRFYEKMYDDLKTPASVDALSQKSRLQEQMLKIMDKTLENGNFTADEATDLFNGAFDAIRHIND